MKKFSLPTLTAMVVGSMIGSGIFMLPRRFGEATGVYGALLAWAVAGAGMFMLARVFQTLAERRPDLDAGVYAYAKAGFGNYLGFASAMGYWAGTFIGNVSYFVLIMSTFGLIKYVLTGRTYFYSGDTYTLAGPVDLFGEGDTILAVALSSIIIWSVHFMILRGIKQAAFINQIVTVAKILPIVLFVIIAVGFGMSGATFSANLSGGEGYTGSIFEQVRATMGVTLFVFLGVEGASVYSRYAHQRQDVGRATVVGFIGVTCLMILITIIPYAVMPRAELAAVRQPSMAGVMEAIVGPWGAVFICVGLIVSVLGAYLAWSLIAAEVMWSAAKTRDMPALMARENKNGVPSAALWATNMGTQLILITTLFSADALRLMVDLTGAMTLIPYLLVAAFGWKLAFSGESYDAKPEGRTGDMIRAAIATLYTAFLVFALGMKFLLLSAIIYAPGSALYIWARREQNERVFTPWEWVLFALAIIGATIGVHGLATGYITL